MSSFGGEPADVEIVATKSHAMAIANQFMLAPLPNTPHGEAAMTVNGIY